MATSNASRFDIYARITDKIIADLERGVRPWMQPWNAEHAAGRIVRPLRHNGIPYKGINVLMLWCSAAAKGYSAPLWLTFRQAQELGGNVRKGEHGELVVYADRITRTETDAKGAEVEKAIPFLKGYTVFNAEQIDGLPAHYYARAEPAALPLFQRIEAADRFFAATGADIRQGGARAYYAPSPRPHPDASVRDVSRRGKLHRNPRARAYPLDETRQAPGPRLRPDAPWRRRLRPRGTGGGVRKRVSLCGFGHYPRSARRPRGLHRNMAQCAEGRQTLCLCRRKPCAARRGLSS